MAEQAVAVLAPLIDELPAVDKPVEQMSPAELLGMTSREGLLRLYELLRRPLDAEDLKAQRLVGDMALGVNRLLMRAAEGEFRARRDDALARVLEQIAAERAGKAGV